MNRRALKTGIKGSFYGGRDQATIVAGLGVGTRKDMSFGSKQAAHKSKQPCSGSDQTGDITKREVEPQELQDVRKLRLKVRAVLIEGALTERQLRAVFSGQRNVNAPAETVSQETK